LLVYPTYTIFAHRGKGQTIGKWFCGLAVAGSDGKVAGLGRIALSETLGESLSVIPFGGGFIWCAISRRKRVLVHVAIRLCYPEDVRG